MARYTRAAVFSNVNRRGEEGASVFVDERTADGQTVANPLTLFVGRLDPRATELTLHQLFKPFGPVTECAIAWNRDASNAQTFGKPRGHAYVSLASPEQAQRAIAALDGRQVGDQRICVRLARARVAVDAASLPAPGAVTAPLSDDARRAAIAMLRATLAQRAEPAKRKLADDAADASTAASATTTAAAAATATTTTTATNTNTTNDEDDEVKEKRPRTSES